MNHCRRTVGKTMYVKRTALMIDGLGDRPGGSGGNGPVSRGPTETMMTKVHADHMSERTKV